MSDTDLLADLIPTQTIDSQIAGKKESCVMKKYWKINPRYGCLLWRNL